MLLDFGQGRWDRARDGRCIRCEKTEAGHLETRQTISNAIVNPWDVFGSKGKIELQCLEGNKSN